MKIRPVGAEFLHAGRQKKTHDEANSCIFAWVHTNVITLLLLIVKLNISADKRTGLQFITSFSDP
jgi:hypothetical protein